MMQNRNPKRKELYKFLLASVFIGFICTMLGEVLKTLTENYEHDLFELAERHPLFFFLFPFIGLSLIYLFRQYLFKKKENKGIKEILASLKSRHNELPVYKIPSHFINGLITVAFGGSSGIEVSIVVASASVGSVTQKKARIHNIYRKELICAGVAAAVTVLFNSPWAGALFALEVILRKVSKTALISILLSVFTVSFLSWLIDTKPIFYIEVNHWNHEAFPYFIVLGMIAGLNSVYLTKCVLFFKSKFSLMVKSYQKIILGSILIGFCLMLFPQLYGDGYRAMKDVFQHSEEFTLTSYFFFILFGIVLLKPVVTSLTLAAGGDGGVFAPSLFIGAFLGLLLALVLNHFFDANVIPLNFMVIGMGAVLSASLHAPFTAVFLVCGIVNNYSIVIPLLTACYVAKLIARIIVPYTVYSYGEPNTKKFLSV
jgi:CIC family chloride channel protein